MAAKESIFARKLETLFDEVRKADGAKYTQAEVVEGTNGVLTRVYLWKLRTGRAGNPGFHIIQALADFFKVDVGYFSHNGEDSAEREQPQPAGKYFDEIVNRASQLDDQAQKALLSLMDYIISTHPRENKKDTDEQHTD
jgi:transcriptional regulator with XRE-family HTH domain